MDVTCGICDLDSETTLEAGRPDAEWRTHCAQTLDLRSNLTYDNKEDPKYLTKKDVTRFAENAASSDRHTKHGVVRSRFEDRNNSKSNTKTEESPADARATHA